MNKRVFTIIIALFLAAFVPKVWGQEADVWDGSIATTVTPVDDIYTIKTGAELAWVAQVVNNGTVNFSGKTIKLAGYIDLSGKDWTPIGTESFPFASTLDGDGYTISGLKVNMESGFAGLFGKIDSRGTVKNLAVTGTAGTTGSGGIGGVGGIAGYNGGTIQNCYTNVSVTSTSSSSGGIAGYNNGTIQNCYTTGSVTANNAGGIVGQNGNSNALIQYCYATGTIKGKQAGGITGILSAGSVKNCIALNSGITGSGDSPSIGRVAGSVSSGTTLTDNYAAPSIPGAWTTGRKADEKNGTDLTTGNFIGASATAFDGWANNGWAFGDNANLPTLSIIKAEQSPSLRTPFLTAIITTKEELAAIKYYLAGNYKLGKDIDLKDESGNEVNWTPLGDNSTPFTGTLDGCGFTISGLKVEVTGYTGLFGEIGSSGTVRNLAVTGTAGVTGSTGAGGIAGLNKGTIENCYTSVPVTATSDAGGIAGFNQGSIRNCYTTGNCSSSKKAGGIAGNNEGNLSYCYATGAISGNNAGGIVGYLKNRETVYSCIALNQSITGGGMYNGRVAGVVGNSNTSDDANYASPAISGKWNIIEVTAMNGANLTDANFIASNGAFTGWTSWKLDANNGNWLFDANFTNLPKLMTTGLTPNKEIASQPTITRAASFGLIKGETAYTEALHKDRNIIIAPDGLLTVDATGAQVSNLEIQPGGQLNTTKALTVKGKMTTKRTLDNKWITFGAPAEMEVTGSKLYAKTGYSAEGNQAWTTATGNAGTTLTLAAAPYIVAAEAEEKDLAFTTTATRSIELPAVPTTPDNGNALNNGIFLFRTNSALCNQTLTDVYILNADGTRFELKRSYDVKPFECYLVANPVTRASVQSLRVGGSGTPTGNEPALPTDAFRLWAADGQLHLEASQPADVQIYTLAGALSHSFRLDGSRTITLPRGIYLVRSNNITYKVSL